MNENTLLLKNIQVSLELVIDDLVNSISLINAVNKHHAVASSSLDAVAAFQLLDDSERQFSSTIKAILKKYSAKEILACASFNPVREWVRQHASANEIMAMLQHHIDPVSFGIEISEYSTIATRNHTESTLQRNTATLIELAYHIQVESDKAA